MSDTSIGTGTKAKKPQGFAALTPERQRELAAKGGRNAHLKGTAHEWTSKEAQEAGRKGGKVSKGGRAAAINNQGEA